MGQPHFIVFANEKGGTGKSTTAVHTAIALAASGHRVGAALSELSRRVGFRVIPGLGERVIYRELFPKGLTLLDLGDLGEVGLGHIAARQELREMIAGLAVPSQAEIEQPPKAATVG